MKPLVVKELLGWDFDLSSLFIWEFGLYNLYDILPERYFYADYLQQNNIAVQEGCNIWRIKTC